jgi:O-antigen ligase
MTFSGTKFEGSDNNFKLDFFAATLLIFAGLNLNGVILLLIRTQALLSPAVLIIVTILFLRHVSINGITEIYFLFSVFIFSYLICGFLFGANEGYIEWFYVKMYFSSWIFVTGIYFWLFSLGNKELKNALKFLKTVLLIACIFTLLSTYLASYFSYVAPAERASGLFENPNEAAVAALYALVLTVAYPARKTILKLTQISLAVAAIILPFSKNGILILSLLIIFILLEKRSFKLLTIFSIGFVIAFWASWYIYDNDLFNLSRDQRERLADVLDLIKGEFNARSTTGRTLLWEFGIDKIAQLFPWGAGLGQFHHMEGGYRGMLNEWLGTHNTNTYLWLGIHNTYLMILGEAGLASFLLFVLFLLRMIVCGLRSEHWLVMGGFTIVLLGDMLSSHSVLSFRLANVVLAVMMTIAGKTSMSIAGSIR